MELFLKLLDWFIPEAAKQERSDLGLARNFVFTHLFGPALAQSISLFLYRTDPDPGFACWTIIICIWSFWLLPFALKLTKSLQLVALISVQILAFAALFGSYHYGGVSSPFMPWLIVSLLLGFFYLSDRPLLIGILFTCNLAGFCAAYILNGFPELVPLSDLATVGWISILSATVYMSWMAIYYASVLSMRSELEVETERHRATAIRLQHAKDLADKASRGKTIFLAKMSHELRTPLNAVIGYSEILLEDCEADARNETKLADLRRINAAGKHLLSLVTDVLDLSKIESAAMELTVERFSLKDFVQEVVATARPMVVARGNKLTINSQDGLGYATTDATKLRQVAINLLSNAAKFTRDGVITLTLRRVTKPGADWIEIRVEDTGIGISDAEMPKLFKDFGQASASISGTYGGTGLGLALSQKLCALIGGGISVQSQVGRGSCFTVRVPGTLQVTQHETQLTSSDRLESRSPLTPSFAG